MNYKNILVYLLIVALCVATARAQAGSISDSIPVPGLSERLHSLGDTLDSPSYYQLATRYIHRLPEECRRDSRFVGLLRTRFALFSAMHASIDPHVMELLLNRETSFFELSFFENYSLLDELKTTPFRGKQNWHLFLQTLLEYHQKIINTADWQATFDELAKNQSMRRYLARAQTYHDRGFPKHESHCYMLETFLDNDAGWDKGTEGWFYSFWLRRYMEGNFDITRIMLDWGNTFLAGTDYVESEQMRQYRDRFYATLPDTVEPEPEPESVEIAEAPVITDCLTLPGPKESLIERVTQDHDKTFRFDPFFDIDWKSKAPVDIRSIDSSNLSYEQIARLRQNVDMWLNAKLAYKAPLDCTESIGAYYMISDAGVHPVRLRHLEGVARFSTNESKSSFSGPKFYGDIIFESEAPQEHEGGFMMLTGLKLDGPFLLYRDPDFSVSADDRRVTYTYRIRKKEFKLETRLEHAPTISTIYQFEHRNRHYIYVRWGIDSSFGGRCRFNATLFRAHEYDSAKKLEEVKWSRYGCDI